MIYLKIFEEFGNNDIEDLLEDFKWILIELVDSNKLFSHEKDYCFLYEVSNIPKKEDIESAKGRLEDLGYELIYIGDPAIANGELQGKKICWIVKSEFYNGDTSILPQGVHRYAPKYFEYNEVIEDVQKNIMLKIWEDEPTIIKEKMNNLCIFNNKQILKVRNWLIEYLGPKAKEIINEILLNKEHHILKGGYDFHIKVDGYDIDDILPEIDINCIILGGSVTLINSGSEMEIEDAIKDDQIGWEIKFEVEDSIVDSFSDIILKNTGYRVNIQQLKVKINGRETRL